MIIVAALAPRIVAPATLGCKRNAPAPDKRDVNFNNQDMGSQDTQDTGSGLVLTH